MAPPFKHTECIDCGKKRSDKVSLNRKGCCIECSIRRDVQCIQQLRAKSGPYYDRWLEGIMRGVVKLYPVGVGDMPPDPFEQSGPSATDQA